MMRMALALVVVLTLCRSAPAQQQSDTDRLQATKMCAEQARSVGPRIIAWDKEQLAEKSGKPKSTEADGFTWDFSGHYNGDLKRCFVEIKSDLGKGIVTAEVYDAYEGQFIAKLIRQRNNKEQPDKSFRYQEIFGKQATDEEYDALMTK